VLRRDARRRAAGGVAGAPVTTLRRTRAVVRLEAAALAGLAPRRLAVRAVAALVAARFAARAVAGFAAARLAPRRVDAAGRAPGADATVVVRPRRVLLPLAAEARSAR
jgi:hypothetical protein